MDPNAETPEQVERQPVAGHIGAEPLAPRALQAGVGSTEQLESSIQKLSDTMMIVTAKLRALAKPACRHCYGRGHTGTNVTTGALMPCRCYIKAYVKKHKAEAQSGSTATPSDKEQ